MREVAPSLCQANGLFSRPGGPGLSLLADPGCGTHARGDLKAKKFKTVSDLPEPQGYGERGPVGRGTVVAVWPRPARN